MSASDLLPYVIIAFMVMTALVLVMGLVNMVRGKPLSKQTSNRLMWLRVMLQAAAVMALLMLYFVMQT